MGPALFTRTSRLPRAVAARSQILAERRANRQRLRRPQFVLLVRAARGSWRFQRIKRYSSRWSDRRLGNQDSTDERSLRLRAVLTVPVLWLVGIVSASAAEKVALIQIDGAIGPATASYISRSIDEARAQNAQCLIIQLNTPGGLLDSTQTIVQSFLGSTVPVVVYVAPTGATATSAGCFITVAASVAAMAPATTIGAAHPVTLGGNPTGGGEEKPDQTMKQKLENFSISYIEAIAGRRHHNVEWAKSAVRESASIGAEKALELKVIDLIAIDLADLLKQLNGRVVDGRTLKTSGAEISEIKMSASE